MQCSFISASALDFATEAVLRRAIAGGYDVTVAEGATDVNKDGAVNAKDVTVLRRFIAGGYDVTLGE